MYVILPQCLFKLQGAITRYRILHKSAKLLHIYFFLIFLPMKTWENYQNEPQKPEIIKCFEMVKQPCFSWRLRPPSNVGEIGGAFKVMTHRLWTVHEKNWHILRDTVKTKHFISPVCTKSLHCGYSFILKKTVFIELTPSAFFLFSLTEFNH